MSMNYSAEAQRALAETWSKLIGGNGDAWIKFYTGKMPESPDHPVTTQKLLARLYINPFTLRPEPANAIASGDTTWARIVGASGRAVADCVVSTKDGPGCLTFNTVGFRQGGPFSFSVACRCSISSGAMMTMT
jgi:hypothetical protein